MFFEGFPSSLVVGRKKGAVRVNKQGRGVPIMRGKEGQESEEASEEGPWGSARWGEERGNE
jgi:hypothetical protein